MFFSENNEWKRLKCNCLLHESIFSPQLRNEKYNEIAVLEMLFLSFKY